MSTSAELHSLVVELGDALQAVEARVSELTAAQQDGISDLDLAALRDDVTKAKGLSASAVATSSVVTSGTVPAPGNSSPTPATPSTGDASGATGVVGAPVPAHEATPVVPEQSAAPETAEPVADAPTATTEPTATDTGTSDGGGTE